MIDDTNPILAPAPGSGQFPGQESEPGPLPGLVPDLGQPPDDGEVSDLGLAVDEVGLDDLFGGPPTGTSGGASRRVVPGGRWLLGRGFFSVVLASLIFGVLYVMGYVAPYPLLVITIFVITLMKYVLARIGVQPLPAQLTGRGLRTSRAPATSGRAGRSGRTGSGADGLDRAVDRWAVQLRQGARDSSWYMRAVLPRLGELVDERLRLRHGVTRASDPRRAREMMGEHLWKMLNDPSVGGTPRDMAVLVTQIEEL